VSLLKHFGEQGDEHGGRLFWSSNLPGGIPFRGNTAPTLTRDEIETSVDVQWDFYCQEFDVAKPEDREKYRWVMERAVNGWFYVHHVERWRDRKGGARLIYVEWSQRYGQLSPQAQAARSYGYASQSDPSVHLRRPLAGLQGADE
jgi:hypothetical protein